MRALQRASAVQTRILTAPRVAPHGSTLGEGPAASSQGWRPSGPDAHSSLAPGACSLSPGSPSESSTTEGVRRSLQQPALAAVPMSPPSPPSAYDNGALATVSTPPPSPPPLSHHSRVHAPSLTAAVTWTPTTPLGPGARDQGAGLSTLGIRSLRRAATTVEADHAVVCLQRVIRGGLARRKAASMHRMHVHPMRVHPVHGQPMDWCQVLPSPSMHAKLPRAAAGPGGRGGRGQPSLPRGTDKPLEGRLLEASDWRNPAVRAWALAPAHAHVYA